MSISIDVIIPSFRLNADTLLPILQLARPADALVTFYLIADNPTVQPDTAIMELVDDKTIHLLINAENEGASFTRNRGIEAGNAEWLLFLDDDIEVLNNLLQIYADAATQQRDEIGFIGVVLMPPPPTLFAQAADANGSMGVFTVAQKQPDAAWGATANIMVKRSAVGEVRFIDGYPKSGGGEEVEFFLRVRERNGFKNYKSLPAAAVTHPWWHNGKTDFARFYRYGKGNSLLAQRNKAYRWYDFLNTPETLLITFIGLTITLHHWAHLAVFMFFVATLVIEYIISIMRVKRSTKQVAPLLSLYVMLLRNVYEAGILFGNLKRGRMAGFGERFNYDGSTKLRHFRFNRFKIVKLILYAITLVLISRYL